MSDATTPPQGRSRRVLTRKRAVLRDSVTVVRAVVRSMWHERFLLRLIGSVLLVAVSGLLLWRAVARPGHTSGKLSGRPVIVGLRLLATLCIQHIVASWLFASWLGETGHRVRSMWRRLAPRLPGFVVCAALLGWLDHATNATAAVHVIRSAAAFGASYVLSYAVPAAAVNRCGLLRGFGHTYRAFRRTFGADLFAWSGVWLVNGATALLSAVPEALDLYSTAPSGGRPLLTRLVGWLVIVPSTIGSLAIGAGFCTVIFFALERNRPPAGYPHAAVETVSGLQLDA